MSTLMTYDRISPTAKFVAYLRTFSDIPYSSEIAKACNAKETFEQIVGAEANDFLWVAPIIEMRYKAIEALLEQSSFKNNIVELAAGVSPRGLIRSGDEACCYLETDLPEILSEKLAIIKGIRRGETRRWHQCAPINATDQNEFLRITEYTNSGGIAVINEGLLPYLDDVEKERVARNIYRLLKLRGGVWITPDVSTGDRIKMLESEPRILKVLKTIRDLTGRDLRSNCCHTIEAARQFFQDIGFDVTVLKQRELVPVLSSVSAVGGDNDKIESMLEHARVMVMRVL